MTPLIAIGAPVRNRAWILPEYLAALLKIDYPDKRFIFLENNSIDATPGILLKFRLMHGADLGIIAGKAPGHRRKEYNANQYSHLANIRNQFIDMFLKTDADYLLSVDSDIIVPADILQKLLPLSDDKTIVAAAISNIPDKPLDGHVPGNFMVKRNGVIMHPPEYSLTGTMDVDVTGAVYLIPRTVLEAGVRYGADAQGEDLAWCKQSKEKGFRLVVDMDCRPDHRMVER